MFNESRKFKQALFYLLFLQLLVWTIMSLAGCGGNEKIPPASILTSDEVMLTWDDVTYATAYNIYWSDKPGVTKKNGTKISNVKNPYKITGLQKGKKYYFIVTTVNASGESKESEEISFIVGQ
jgi:fibronectin type 3 domain-containing protein